MLRDNKIDYMIVGAHKAGTSSLYQYLLDHPQLVGHTSPEFVYFLRDDIYDKGLSGVLELFPSSSTQRAIAKSAGQMYSLQAMQRLYEHNPKTKLVLLLRNPVDRAYSAFWFNVRTGRESNDDFLKAFKTPLISIKDPILRRECDYLGRGLYFYHIKNILEYFPLENIHIGLFEDFKSDTKSYIKEIIEFLDLESYELDTSTVHNSKSGVKSKTLAKMIRPGQKNILTQLLPDTIKRGIKKQVRKINETKLDAPPLNPDLRREIATYYLDDIISLEKLLDRNLKIWMDKN